MATKITTAIVPRLTLLEAVSHFRFENGGGVGARLEDTSVP
jgi:hypothetical protein